MWKNHFWKFLVPLGCSKNTLCWPIDWNWKINCLFLQNAKNLDWRFNVSIDCIVGQRTHTVYVVGGGGRGDITKIPNKISEPCCRKLACWNPKSRRSHNPLFSDSKFTPRKWYVTLFPNILCLPDGFDVLPAGETGEGPLLFPRATVDRQHATSRSLQHLSVRYGPLDTLKHSHLARDWHIHSLGQRAH